SPRRGCMPPPWASWGPPATARLTSLALRRHAGDGVGLGERHPGRRAGPPAPGDRVRARLAHHEADHPAVARDEARLDGGDVEPGVPQRAASGPPTPPGAGGSSTRQSLRLLDVAVEGETTIGVGAEPVRDSTQVGELHTLRAAAFKQLRGESLAGVHANVGEAYASTEDIRVLRSFDHSRAKHYPH